MATPDPAATKTEEETRYLLITECLQNDIFLNPGCRIFLQDESVRQLLVAKKDHEAYRTADTPRRVPAKLLERGPLGVFLKAAIGQRFTGVEPDILHVINIRDWHVADAAYDAERRAYGRHCEAGTWGAGYIDGLEQYLDPEPPWPDGKARFCDRGTARIYHIHADSIFDFRPRWDERTAGEPKFHPSELERLLDVLITGSGKEVDQLAAVLKGPAGAGAGTGAVAADVDRRQSQALNALALHASSADAAARSVKLYVAVIGVYTDIKVQLLLSGLRARYELPNLAVSDTLTGSRNLERHLHGLDFADKLLNVEVIHGIGDLAGFLGSQAPLEDETEIISAPNYNEYRTFFGDKQNVLAYEGAKLQEYAELTGKRAIGVYNTIKRANTFLLIWGCAFLTVSLLGTLLHLVSPARWSWQMTVATGGIGLVQLVAAFFSKPMRDLQGNLTNLASLRMILESHSLKTAFTRYHLTTPEVLRELKDPGEAGLARAQINTLEAQLAVIDRFQASDYESLAKIVGFPSTAGTNGDGDGSSNGNGGGPAEAQPAAQQAGPAAPAEPAGPAGPA